MVGFLGTENPEVGEDTYSGCFPRTEGHPLTPDTQWGWGFRRDVVGTSTRENLSLRDIGLGVPHRTLIPLESIPPRILIPLESHPNQ